MAKRAESRSARRSRLTGKVEALENVPDKTKKSPRTKFVPKKKPKAPPRPTADKSKRKPNKVKPIENDHSKPDKKPKPTAKNPTKSAPKPDVSGGSDTKSRIRATASSKALTNMRGGRVAAVIAGVAAIAGAIGYYGNKNRDARKARIKGREAKAGAGKASFIEDQPTIKASTIEAQPTSKPSTKYKYNQNTRPKAFDKPNTPRSKFGMPPKKPTSPARKTSIDTESYAGASKVTGASAAPAPKPINKPAGTKNTPDMFSQFMSNLTGVKVTPNNSKGPVKHDSNGTTASNQTGGALFGLIKDKKKKGSR